MACVGRDLKDDPVSIHVQQKMIYKVSSTRNLQCRRASHALEGSSGVASPWAPLSRII